MIHPDYLLEKLSARQLLEWWVLHTEEPFGDVRADMRAWAHACIGWGALDVKLTWPYVDPGLSPEEIRAEMDRIEAAILETQQHDHRREDFHPD